MWRWTGDLIVVGRFERIRRCSDTSDAIVTTVSFHKRSNGIIRSSIEKNFRSKCPSAHNSSRHSKINSFASRSAFVGAHFQYVRVLETCFSRFGDGKKKRHRLIDGSQAFCQAGEKISDKIPLEINETKNSELVYVKLLCCTRLLIISNKTLTGYLCPKIVDYNFKI